MSLGAGAAAYDWHHYCVVLERLDGDSGSALQDRMIPTVYVDGAASTFDAFVLPTKTEPVGNAAFPIELGFTSDTVASTTAAYLVGRVDAVHIVNRAIVSKKPRGVFDFGGPHLGQFGSDSAPS